jgi:hypothetical protein
LHRPVWARRLYPYFSIDRAHMKYDPHRHASNSPDDAVKAGLPPAQSASPRIGSTLAELAELYDPEVFDFVREQLNHGMSHGQAVAALCEQDFSEDESRVIVRAVIEDRVQRGIMPAMNPIGLLTLGQPQHQGASDIETQTFRRRARRTQGTREMTAGASLIGLGVLLSITYYGINVFFGTLVVGIILIIRGAATYIDRR